MKLGQLSLSNVMVEKALDLTYNVDENDRYHPVGTTCNQNHLLLHRQRAYVASITSLTNAQEALAIVKIDASATVATRLT